MKLKNCLLILSATAFFSSCYYDKEEKIYGIAPCDTSNIKYSVQIVSTISTNCLRCHGAARPCSGVEQQHRAAVFSSAIITS